MNNENSNGSVFVKWNLQMKKILLELLKFAEGNHSNLTAIPLLAEINRILKWYRGFKLFVWMTFLFIWVDIYFTRSQLVDNNCDKFFTPPPTPNAFDFLIGKDLFVCLFAIKPYIAWSCDTCRTPNPPPPSSTTNEALFAFTSVIIAMIVCSQPLALWFVAFVATEASSYHLIVCGIMDRRNGECIAVKTLPLPYQIH